MSQCVVYFYTSNCQWIFRRLIISMDTSNFHFCCHLQNQKCLYIQYRLNTFTYDFILLYFHVFDDRWLRFSQNVHVVLKNKRAFENVKVYLEISILNIYHLKIITKF